MFYSIASWWTAKRHLLKTWEWEEDTRKREAAFEAECEKVLMQIYGYLTKVQDYLDPVISFDPWG